MSWFTAIFLCSLALFSGCAKKDSEPDLGGSEDCLPVAFWHDDMILDSIIYTDNKISQLRRYSFNFAERLRARFEYTGNVIKIYQTHSWNDFTYELVYVFTIKDSKIISAEEIGRETRKYFYSGNKLSHILYLHGNQPTDSLSVKYDRTGTNITDSQVFRYDGTSGKYNPAETFHYEFGTGNPYLAQQNVYFNSIYYLYLQYTHHLFADKIRYSTEYFNAACVTDITSSLAEQNVSHSPRQMSGYEIMTDLFCFHPYAFIHYRCPNGGIIGWRFGSLDGYFD